MTSEAYDESLVGRLRAALAPRTNITEQRKMGGTTFLVDGKVCVRDHRGELMARCRPELTAELLARPGVRRFEMAGKREMAGWLVIARDVAEAELDFWVQTALEACEAAGKSRRR